MCIYLKLDALAALGSMEIVKDEWCYKKKTLYKRPNKLCD